MANIKDSYLDNIGYIRQKAIELELKKSDQFEKIKKELSEKSYNSIQQNNNQNLDDGVVKSNAKNDTLFSEHYRYIHSIDFLRKCARLIEQQTPEIKDRIKEIDDRCDKAKTDIEKEQGTNVAKLIFIIEILQSDLNVPKNMRYRFATDVFTKKLAEINSKYKRNSQDIIKIGLFLVRNNSIDNYRFEDSSYVDEVTNAMKQYKFNANYLIKAGLQMARIELLEKINTKYKSEKIDEKEKVKLEEKINMKYMKFMDKFEQKKEGTEPEQ